MTRLRNASAQSCQLVVQYIFAGHKNANRLMIGISEQLEIPLLSLSETLPRHLPQILEI